LQKKTVKQIIEKLSKEYPPIKTSLEYNSVFELLIATILSAQCTDKQVNITTKKLFKEYNKPEDFIKINRNKLQKIIKSTGYYKIKTDRIIKTSKKLKKNFNSKVPDTMDDLLKLDGVGRKTANIVLSVGYNKTVGIAVDTHVNRVSNRLGLASSSNPEKIEEELMKIIPEKNWDNISILLILHGRNICLARKPKCQECILNNTCPSKIEY
jgi:endonuclease-3